MILPIFLGVFLFNAPFPASAQETSYPVVETLTIEGNRAVSRGDLHLLMYTRESPWYAWLPGAKPRRFDAAVFRTDVARILTRYRDLGYLDAVVDTSVDRSRPGKVWVRIRILEGEVIRTSDVRLEGLPADLEADSSRVRKELQTGPGRPLTRIGLDADRDFIARELQDRGHAFAEVKYGVKVKPEVHQADVTFRSTPGPRCRVGRVVVTGNRKISEGVIRRGLTFRSGEVYRKRRLLSSQRQLYRSGAFRSVILSLPDSAVGASPVGVVVSVAERPLRSLKIGAGYDTESRLKGSLGWTHRSFLGGARQFRIETALSSLNAEGEVSLRQPYMWGSRNWLNVGARIQRERKATFEKKEVSGNVSLERNIRTHTSLILRTSAGLVNSEADSALADFKKFTEFRLSFQEDTRDDFFDPQKGVLISLSAQESGLLFRSDREFLRLTGEGRWYRKLPWQSVLALRVAGGAIQELGKTVEVPNIERFFGGGMHSVRGWDLDELGPRDASGVVVGGKSLLEGSIELRTRLLPFLGAAVFLDGGNVERDLSAFIWGQLRWSAGAGLRYLSPIGPFRIDVAFRLSSDPFAGRRQTHISLGQAF